jgi:transcriptional regulator with XRE-family HTH domain
MGPSEVFQERLRTAREFRELSQGELAQRAGLQASAVSHFETGTRKPSFDNLKRLADALKVSTDYLLGRTTEMQATAASADRLHRHYSGLSAEYQEMADEFVEMLAQRAQQKKDAGGQ